MQNPTACRVQAELLGFSNWFPVILTPRVLDLQTLEVRELDNDAPHMILGGKRSVLLSDVLVSFTTDWNKNS